ncbi:inner membrane protein yrbG [Candidatus Photodesmus blepharus]|uniref:Inner membrane protein yrbG n=1 Tax=Candidatus Photodesmus blepharonis TaxID=1179155 RepID=A0A084CM42_9GAMM|nr:calcium/sodium antiporter [Candidatus Photodesmus blepharus]KEY90871.1 inner membrane protein yrbG [Candidatus Photodesmus blepharus]
MVKAIMFLIIALIFLAWSANKLVIGAATLAHNIGLSPIVIGMTILAIGSSIPEMILSITVAMEGKINTAVGNILGSNIANVTLILGILAMVKPVSLNTSALYRELPLMIIVTSIAGTVLWDHHLSLCEGLWLLIAFITLTLVIVHISRKNKTNIKEKNISKNMSNFKALIWTIFALIVLPLSSDNLVSNAVLIAKHFGMSDLMIGLTIISVGTSLPELTTSLVGILKGESDMVIGNIIGSNIFNILVVMGISGILNPSFLTNYAMERDFWVMFSVSLLLVTMVLDKSRTINFIKGSILLTLFVAYQTYLIININA